MNARAEPTTGLQHVIRRTTTESFEYDPAEINALWLTHRDGFPEELLGGDEDTDEDARVIALFSAFDGSLISPFSNTGDFDLGHELYVEDEDGNVR